MRVVLDCRSVFEGMGGIGRATAGLARALPDALGPFDELVLLTGARPPEASLAPEGRAQEVPVDAAMLDPAFEQVRLPGLLAELEADVYHGPCFAVPLAAEVARVATVHDVVFRRHPELVAPELRAYLDRWTGVSCAVAERVLTVSECARAEIAALTGRPAARIDVVPNGVDPAFFALGDRRPARASSGDDPARPPYLLYVGALERKKRIDALLAAFAAMVARAPDLPHELVLAGGAGGQPFDLEAALATLEPAARARVRAPGRVGEADLHALYAGADAFCYLSEYEGFGLPPLEAMAAGVPAVVADRSSLPEVTGGAALLVDPDDPPAAAEVVAALLRDPARRADLARRGRARAGAFRWPDVAPRVLAVYRAAVADPAAADAAAPAPLAEARP